MTTETRLMHRIADLYAHDPQFAAARPSSAISDAVDQPGQSLSKIIDTVLTGYADRPALAQRAVSIDVDPATGRRTAQLLPHFDTLTYSELRDRADAVTNAWLHDGVAAGDRVAILGFTSVDYTAVDIALVGLGAVSVPLQTSAPVASLLPIVTETEPVLIASSVDFLSDAVELIITGHASRQLVVFDFHPAVDDHRDALAEAQQRLTDAGSAVVVETLQSVLSRGTALPVALRPEPTEPDPLSLLIYTSGSTGAPKGAMYPESKAATMWRASARAAWDDQHEALPAIVLSFMPMSHMMGRGILFGALSTGGTVYFAARSDLSTFLDDLALSRPTQLSFVPRIWEMLFNEYQSQVDRQPDADVDDVLAELRQSMLGGRFVTAMTGSAPISPEMKTWVEKLLDLHLVEGYGSTEAGAVFVDGVVRRPPVLDYKLIDVPDLGYFHTDRPHPRGELLIKSEQLFPGYYKRPEVTAEMFDADGFYRTGDIVAETGPDHLEYLDRRNNVLKLAQGEFVTVSKLEAIFSHAPLVRQIYLYGNSARSYLLAVIVPTEDALAQQDLGALKGAITESLQRAARTADLQSYEVPRDFLIETTPFTLENGLLTGIRKLARPNLKAQYAPRLEELYVELADGQANELRALRHSGAGGSVLETVGRAAAALLGAAASDLQPDAHFTDLGGDSLSALTFANLLHEIFGVDVPVGVIVSPASDLAAIAGYVEAQRAGGSKRPTYDAVHGRDATEVHAADLTLDQFLDSETLHAAA
ncbi:MAG: AMP-binding protein, partial [Mycobacterium sp.]